MPFLCSSPRGPGALKRAGPLIPSDSGSADLAPAQADPLPTFGASARRLGGSGQSWLRWLPDDANDRSPEWEGS